MAHSYRLEDVVDDDAPKPTPISREEMLAELQKCSVHSDSPMGRGVLGGGKVFVDDEGRAFLVRHAAAPARAERDRGDDVADALYRQLGRQPSQLANAEQSDPTTLGPRNPVTGLRPGQDVGDAVAERLLELRVTTR